MTYVNPSPSQLPDEKRLPKPRISLSRCFDDWVLFMLCQLVNTTIITFDLAADWMLLGVLSSLWIQNHIQDGRHVSRAEAFTARLPTLFIVFVSMATVMFIINIVHTLAHFWQRRIQYRSKIDDALPKPSILEKCVNDLVITGPLIFQNLPLMVLLFSLQLSIGCDFYFIVYDKSTIVLSIVTTITNVTWKLCQTIWNWGCFGRRDVYYSGVVTWVLRSFNSVLLCIVFIFAVLNMYLVNPMKNIYPVTGNRLLDKVGLDAWADMDYVVIAIATDSYVPQNNSKLSSDNVSSISYQYKDTAYTSYHNVIKVKHIFTHGHASHNVIINESRWMEILTTFGNMRSERDDERYDNCTLDMSFQNQFRNNEILYNIGYRCGVMTDSNCILNSLQPITFRVFSNQTKSAPAWSLPVDVINKTPKDSASVAMTITKYEENVTWSGEPPAKVTVVRPHVTLSWTIAGQSTPCDVSFSQDTTLSLPNNVC